MLDLPRYPLRELAASVGTPFYLYDANHLRGTLATFRRLLDETGLAGRYSMKANSSRRVLEMVREAGLWIDAASAIEVERALAAGFPGGTDPPAIMLTTDVFRDHALALLRRHRVLPNIGSPGMVDDLVHAGYRGPVAVRVNPGFGHGHVESCDTGGPSSKHGIWPDDLPAVRRHAEAAGLRVTGLHAHVGTGPELAEFEANIRALVAFLESLAPGFPDLDMINLGGGIPHQYDPSRPPLDLDAYRASLAESVERLPRAAGRAIRIEIEPGRHLVAGMGVLVTRVCDIKSTRDNVRGPGHTFVMVDAGFSDLVRAAMYGAYHHIEIAGRRAGRRAEDGAPVSCVVAGPLCESGDVFTRSETELLAPRLLPPPSRGDLLVLHDTGAYGASMSSNYVSMPRVPEVMWDAGGATLISRRETMDDLVRRECTERLTL